MTTDHAVALQAIRQRVEEARAATTAMRDACRLGRVVEFRERDKYVMAIHRALDLVAEQAEMIAHLRAALDDQDQYELSPDDIDDLETQLTDACAEARKRLARGRKLARKAQS